MQVLFPTIVGSAKGCMRVMGWRMLVTGGDVLPREGPALVVCNHVSYLDAIAIGYAVAERGRIPRFLAKRELFSTPVFGAVLRRLRQIPVDRGGSAAESVAAAADALRAGEVVVIFPEATISTSFVPAPPRSGTGRLAVATGVPVIPAALWGGQRLATKNRPRNLQRGVVMAVRVGDPVPYRQDEDPAVVLDRVWAAVTSLVDQAQRTYPQQPAGDDDRWWLPEHLGGTAPSVEDALDLRAREAAARRARARGEDPRRMPDGPPPEVLGS